MRSPHLGTHPLTETTCDYTECWCHRPAWTIRPYGQCFDVVDAAGRIVLLGAPPDTHRDDHEERLSNALLAAAAPELRAALRAALALAILDPDGPAWVRQAETALNKSDGK